MQDGPGKPAQAANKHCPERQEIHTCCSFIHAQMLLSPVLGAGTEMTLHLLVLLYEQGK